MPLPLFLGEIIRSTHSLRGWVGLIAGLDEILPLQGLELRPLGYLAGSQLLYRRSYSCSHYVYIELYDTPRRCSEVR
jgi:hypothetical protein